jgi:hypothetical protein
MFAATCPVEGCRPADFFLHAGIGLVDLHIGWAHAVSAREKVVDVVDPKRGFAALSITQPNKDCERANIGGSSAPRAHCLRARGAAP